MYVFVFVRHNSVSCVLPFDQQVLVSLQAARCGLDRMKRFRRHGQESQRDRIKQELFQFNKVNRPRQFSLAIMVTD